MIIITNPARSITEYIDLCENIYIPPVFGCSHCHYTGKLHRHGSYTKKEFSPNTIKIWLCLYRTYRIDSLILKIEATEGNPEYCRIMLKTLS